MYPVVFKDKCCCGGKLSYVCSGDKFRDASSCAKGAQFMVCDSCGHRYRIKWDVENGEPSPIIDWESALADFLSHYEKCN